MSKSTYTMSIVKDRKTLVTLSTNRSSQENAHRIARQFFAEHGVAGSKMTVLKDGVAVEEFRMDSQGWEYTVLNGATVRAAARAAEAPKTKRTRKAVAA